MRQVVKSFAVMSFAVGALCLTAGSARASTATDGGVFIHGTGDYPGTFSCTGSGGSTHCSVPAAVTGYLTGSGDSSTGTPQEISIVAGSHPWAVVGYSGGSCAPWPPGKPRRAGRRTTELSTHVSTTARATPIAIWPRA